MPKITVSSNSTRAIRVGQTPSYQVKQIRNDEIGDLVTEITELSDVDLSNPQDGQLLVYDANTQTYVLASIDTLIGGSF